MQGLFYWMNVKFVLFLPRRINLDAAISFDVEQKKTLFDWKEKQIKKINLVAGFLLSMLRDRGKVENIKLVESFFEITF